MGRRFLEDDLEQTADYKLSSDIIFESPPEEDATPSVSSDDDDEKHARLSALVISGYVVAGIGVLALAGTLYISRTTALVGTGAENASSVVKPPTEVADVEAPEGDTSIDVLSDAGDDIYK